MNYVVDDTGDLLWSSFTGIANLSGILAYADELVATEGFKFKDQLVDYSQIVLIDLSSDDVVKYINRLQFHLASKEVNPHRRVAVYAPKDIQFGFARMFGARGDVFPSEIRVFRARDQCLEWLARANPNCDAPQNDAPH